MSGIISSLPKVKTDATSWSFALIRRLKVLFTKFDAALGALLLINDSEIFDVSKLFSPNFMIRYAPGHMRDIRGDDVNLRYANLYALNKTSEIEEGLSAILGFDYKINEKDENGNDKEKISLSLGQVFNRKENRDRPSKSSLDQKSSDLVGEFNYNFSEIGQIGYKFSLDHNYENLNYNERVV